MHFFDPNEDTDLRFEEPNLVLLKQPFLSFFYQRFISVFERLRFGTSHKGYSKNHLSSKMPFPYIGGGISSAEGAR